MRKIFYFWIILIGVACIQLHAQDSLVKPAPRAGFGAKVFGGGYFFPSAFSAYPGPAAGGSLSLFASLFEVETGFLYYRKFARTEPATENILGPPHFQSVFH